MKKLIFSLWAMLLAVTAGAASLPTISSGEDVTWYFVQFLNGQNVLTANGEGAKVTTSVPTGRDAQLWKVEGSETGGYTLTSKNGLRLYTSTTATNGMFYAATAPAQNTLFTIQTTTNTNYADGFVISPKSNSDVYMNQWGGAGSGVELGLWNNRADANQPLQFVSIDDFNANGKPLSIIPYPASLTRGEGKLDVHGLTAITYVSDETKALAKDFAEQLARTSGIQLAVQEAGNARTTAAISLAADADIAAEGYRLTVDADGVAISAATRAGFFYALQTLRQLLPTAIYGRELAADAAWTLPHVEIEDAPLFAHRGFMLDEARHFFGKEEVKKQLDAAATYKLNRFHWHLTDDQGWRIEIPEYPKLTTVGAVRKSSLTLNDPTSGLEFYDDTEYGRGMFYTLDDLREIVAYAKERNIEIMPEVDMPGHMVAAIAAYPELSCNPARTYEVRVAKGVSTEILNIGKDEVIDFLKCVLDHVADVFPYELIHLGGDECPTTDWQGNADCERRIAEEGLNGINELQPWLVETLGSYLKEKYGKKVVAWNELQEHWKSEYTTELIIMSWTSNPATAASKGFKSIYSPSPLYYLDMMQEKPANLAIDEPYMGGYGDNTVSRIDQIYNFNPLSGMDADKQDFLLGPQANLWTESCTSSREVDNQFYPRLLAVSEVGWLPAEKKEWVNFYQRLQSQADVLGHLGLNYAKYAFEQPDMNAADAALSEADAIVEAHVDGAVGYPATETRQSLEAAAEALRQSADDAEALAGLQAAIAAYKAAGVKQPEAGKTYKIVSASTYYKNRFEGSTVYAKDGGLGFHYTEQTEPEELWQFVPQQGGGFVIQNQLDGSKVKLEGYDELAILDETGTTFRIDAARKAAGGYTCLPGVVNIGEAASYGSAEAKLLYGTMAGRVKAYADSTLCYPGTWRIVEVTDFTARLQGLCTKCERLLETARPGENDEPTEEALDFLRDSVLAPAREALAQGGVTEETYATYVELYRQFCAMERTSLLDSIDETHFYLIRNAYHTGYYAKADATTGQVIPTALVASDDAFRWAFIKNSNGTVYVLNKATGLHARLNNNAADTPISLGEPYRWTLQEINTDTGQAGIAIIDGTHTYSWYTNPGVWNYLLTKPYDWGASIWSLEQLDDLVTGIARTETETPKPLRYYDLSGRRVAQPERGIYITDRSTKVVK